MIGTLRLLLIEDNEVDRESVRRMLRQQDQFDEARTLAEGTQLLTEHDRTYDCVLLDLGLPDSQGLDTLRSAHAIARAPIVVLTGLDDDELGSAALRLGAQDYLPKSRLEPYLLRRSVRYAIERYGEIRRVRKVAERWHEVLRRVPEVVVILRADATISWINRDLGDRDQASLIGSDIDELIPNSDLGARAREILAGGRPGSCDLQTDGRHFDCRIGLLNHNDDDHAVATIRDVTKEKNLQREVDRAVRMEALGRLAGGVAHDFNNLLTVVLSMTSLTLETEEALSEVAREDLREVVKAGQRAAELTHQLLSFTSRGPSHAQVVDINRAILDLDPMLRRLVTTRGLELVVLLKDQPLRVLIDPSKFEQVIVNLVVNARHAMGDRGTLAIEASRVEWQGKAHARIVAEDDGVGMPPAVLERLFEPFFTTREDGTGLGLSTAYGIVDAAGGHINVTSTAGEGSRFEIFLPLSTMETSVAFEELPVTDSEPVMQTIRVLFIEDQPLVRASLSRVLKRHDIEVASAPSAEEGLEYLRSETEFDLIISDVFLPGISGVELVSRVRASHPGMPILLISGYVAEHISEIPTDDPRTDFLAKPFQPADLIARIHKLLSLER